MARGMRALLIGILGAALVRSDVRAETISDSLGQFINDGLSLVVEGVAFPNVAGEFVQRQALGSLQLPVPANTTSFTYSYNPELGLFERSSGSLGPVFVDRGETIGKGRFDLVFSYQFANLTDLDGDDFGEQLQFGFGAVADGDVPAFGIFRGQDFSLKQNVFSFNTTYGITDRWDVNLLLPLVYTSLSLDGQQEAVLVDSDGTVITAQALTPVSFHDDAFGIGDILLRTKYRFYDDARLALLAGALTLRMPSGNDENFQGLGDFTIMPTFIASRPFGRHDVHANLGMEFNAQNFAASRVRYAIGATIQPFDRVAFLLDILGSSGIEQDDFTVPAGNVSPYCGGSLAGTPLPNVNCVNYTTDGASIEGVVPRSDIVDLSTGIKFNPFASANVYLLAIIPLTDQGLRAAVVPAGGFEWTF